MIHIVGTGGKWGQDVTGSQPVDVDVVDTCDDCDPTHLGMLLAAYGKGERRNQMLMREKTSEKRRIWC